MDDSRQIGIVLRRRPLQLAEWTDAVERHLQLAQEQVEWLRPMAAYLPLLHFLLLDMERDYRAQATVATLCAAEEVPLDVMKLWRLERMEHGAHTVPPQRRTRVEVLLHSTHAQRSRGSNRVAKKWTAETVVERPSRRTGVGTTVRSLVCELRRALCFLLTRGCASGLAQAGLETRRWFLTLAAKCALGLAARLQIRESE